MAIKTYGLCLLFPVMLLGCGTKHLDQEYMALRLHSYWEFSGDIRRIEVVDESSNHDVDYRVRVTVRNSWLLEARVRCSEERFYLLGLDPSSIGYPAIQFEPPLPILPSGLKVGDIEQWEMVESRNTSPTQHCRVRVQTTVLQPFPVVCAGTTFDDVLRIRVEYVYEEPTIAPFLAGVSEWWFARNVGITRYQLGSHPYEDMASYYPPLNSGSKSE